MSTASDDIATEAPEDELTRHCGRCGRLAAADSPVAHLTWTRQRHGRSAWICPVCTRRNLRAIEENLDEVFWD